MKQQKLDLEMIDPVSIDWDPKPDITAHELAKCMQLLLYMNQEGNNPDVKTRLLNYLPQEARRHFSFRYKSA